MLSLAPRVKNIDVKGLDIKFIPMLCRKFKNIQALKNEFSRDGEIEWENFAKSEELELSS